MAYLCINSAFVKKTIWWKIQREMEMPRHPHRNTRGKWHAHVLRCDNISSRVTVIKRAALVTRHFMTLVYKRFRLVFSTENKIKRSRNKTINRAGRWRRSGSKTLRNRQIKTIMFLDPTPFIPDAISLIYVTIKYVCSTFSFYSNSHSDFCR